MTLLLQCIVFWGFAQFTLNGTVKSETGERLVGANLTLSNGFNGTTTDVNGVYLFKNLKAGNYRVTISFIGYEKQLKDVRISGDQTLDVVLKQDHIMRIFMVRVLLLLMRLVKKWAKKL